MDLTISLYFLLGAILLAGSTLQGIVGFASGLFSIPLMLLADVPLEHAIAVNLVASTVQSLLGVWRLSESLPWRTTLRPIAIRFVTLPLGGLLLYATRDWDHAVIKQIIGGILLAAVAAQACWRVKPREKLHSAWEWLAFSLSGTSAGFCGMGGPPMVLWVLAHQWDSARVRAFLFYLFVGGMPPQAAMMLWLFGLPILKTFGFAVLLTPFTASGALLGIAIGNRLPVERLRMLTFVVLLLIAVSAIASPWLA
jgi:uncharacterized membrane protein YfcA